MLLFNPIFKFIISLFISIILVSIINHNLEQQIQSIFINMFPTILSEGCNGTIGEIIKFSNGKKRPETKGNIPVYGGNGILAYTDKANNENCIVIGRVGAYCGSTYLSTSSCWISDNAIVGKSINTQSQLFSFYLLKNAALPTRHIGTSQPLLTQSILSAIPCKIIEVSKIQEFNNLCTPIQLMIDANDTENTALAIVRESLLPQLMSGNITLDNAIF